MNHQKGEYKTKVTLYKRTRHYTEMFSLNTLADLLHVDRKTVNYWVNTLNIEIFSDFLDKRKRLVLTRTEELIRARQHNRVRRQNSLRSSGINPISIPIMYPVNWNFPPQYKKISKLIYPNRVKAYLQNKALYTELISLNSAERLLGLGVGSPAIGSVNRKTLIHWIRKLKIETFYDYIDARKKLILFDDLRRICSRINMHKDRSVYIYNFPKEDPKKPFIVRQNLNPPKERYRH